VEYYSKGYPGWPSDSPAQRAEMDPSRGTELRDVLTLRKPKRDGGTLDRTKKMAGMVRTTVGGIVP
jgi:hypothetical protein